MNIYHILSFIALLLLLGTGQAKVTDQPSKAEVKYLNKRYYVSYTVTTPSSPEIVIAALKNYKELKNLIPSIVDSHLLEQYSEYDLVETHFDSCVLFFCKKAVNTQKIFHDGEEIKAVTLGEHSDFKYGLMTWNIQSSKGITHIEYHAEIEPKFWVPPFIGPPILKHMLSKEANIFSSRITKI